MELQSDKMKVYLEETQNEMKIRLKETQNVIKSLMEEAWNEMKIHMEETRNEMIETQNLMMQLDEKVQRQLEEHRKGMMSRLAETRNEMETYMKGSCNEMQKRIIKMESNHLEIKSQVKNIGKRCEKSTRILKGDIARIFDQFKELKEVVHGDIKNSTRVRRTDASGTT